MAAIEAMQRALDGKVGREDLRKAVGEVCRLDAGELHGDDEGNRSLAALCYYAVGFASSTALRGDDLGDLTTKMGVAGDLHR